MITTLRERELDKKLRSKGYSLKEISKTIHVAKSSVSIWVRDIALNSEQGQRLIEKETRGGIKRNKTLILRRKLYALYPKLLICKKPPRTVDHFFHKWGPDMAYVLGYFAADGCMYRNNNDSYYISFTSADLSLIAQVKKIMQVSNAIEIYQPRRKNSKLRYTLQIGSKRIFKRLLDLGLTPNKSLTLPFPEVPDAYLGHFVRGYFDGDGCAYSGVSKRNDRKESYKKDITIRLNYGSS